MHVKPPVADVVIVESVNVQLAPPVGVCATPLNDTVALELPAKSVPTTFQLAPTGPWRGVTTITGAAYPVTDVGVDGVAVIAGLPTALSPTVTVITQEVVALDGSYVCVALDDAEKPGHVPVVDHT